LISPIKKVISLIFFCENTHKYPCVLNTECPMSNDAVDFDIGYSKFIIRYFGDTHIYAYSPL